MTRIWKIIGGGPGIVFGYALADFRDDGLPEPVEKLLWRHCAGMLANGALIELNCPADILVGDTVARYQFVPWEPELMTVN